MKKNNKKMKKNCIRRFIDHKYFPFFVLALVIMFMHLFVYSNGDDDFFRIQLDNYTLIDYLIMRYNTWSSRIFVEILFVLITRIPLMIWSIMDTVIYTSIGLIISKIFNVKNEKSLNWLISGLILILPFNEMSSAGYVTTTIAYIWTTASLLYVLYITNSVRNDKKIKWYQYLISFICLLVAISFEQSLCLLLGFLALEIIDIIYNKKYKFNKQWSIYLFFAIGLLMMVFTLTCPGNSARTVSEIASWYPEYANFGLLSKIYLGIVPTMSVILYNKVIFSLFSVVLTISIFMNCKEKILRMLAIIQSSFFLLLGFFSSILIKIYPSIERFLVVINTYNVVPKINYNYLIPLGLIVGILLVCTILIYFATNRRILPSIIFLASFASRFIMGFSPTVFASVERTAFFMYIGIIILIYLLFNNIKNNKIKNGVNYSLLIIAIFNVLNIIYTMIIVRG